MLLPFLVCKKHLEAMNPAETLFPAVMAKFKLIRISP